MIFPEVLTVESALQNIWLSVPEAAAIWIILLLVVAGCAAALIVPGRHRTAGRAARRAPEPQPAPDDGQRYANEVAVAAERAAGTARRRRGEWERAHSAVDAAWEAFDQADRAARRAATASAFPVVRRRREFGETLDRERRLHEAAIAACRRGDLSTAQANDVLAHRGWDPRKHPVVHEIALLQAVRDHRFEAYRLATAREQRAWQAAERAAAALGGLRTEAMAAEISPDAGVRPAGAQWSAEQWASTESLPVAGA
jgi:hypothetical protein